ncbi:hypothetical protein [Streptomyces sp. NPDC056387]|uniref:hypothetical protein n=1 Tax=Streptomyces sp. NPDC056387 TaxID=3345803 RepID=UPI0035E0AC0D
MSPSGVMDVRPHPVRPPRSTVLMVALTAVTGVTEAVSLLARGVHRARWCRRWPCPVRLRQPHAL